ncbi:MAG: glycosyltransferase family 4 protein [Phycisphaerae bacterium]
MKVAIVSEWVDTWRGGAETSTMQFVHHLIDSGVEVHLYTRSRPSPTPEMKVHTIGGAGMGRTRKTITFTHRVDRMLRRDAFDIIHAISPCRSATLYQPRGGTVAETIERNISLRRSQAVRTLKRYANQFNLKQRFMLRLEKDIMRAPDGPVIIALSDYVIRQLKQHYSLPEHRISKIFNGVNPSPIDTETRASNRRDVRREFQIDENGLLAIIVAHNFRLKGVEDWMLTHSRLLATGEKLKVIVIGKGDSHLWRKKAQDLGLQDHLIFAGPTDRVAAFRHAADFLIHLSYYDPCSRVVLEALNDGLPCIASSWDGAAELIKDGESGFVVQDPSQHEHICDLVLAMKSHETRTRMAEQAKKAAEPFTMERHAAEVLRLYKEIAAGKRAG